MIPEFTLENTATFPRFAWTMVKYLIRVLQGEPWFLAYWTLCEGIFWTIKLSGH
jgi:hypothetical protein